MNALPRIFFTPLALAFLNSEFSFLKPILNCVISEFSSYQFFFLLWKLLFINFNKLSCKSSLHHISYSPCSHLSWFLLIVSVEYCLRKNWIWKGYAINKWKPNILDWSSFFIIIRFMKNRKSWVIIRSRPRRLWLLPEYVVTSAWYWIEYWSLCKNK